jgi:hypothetical protein
MIIFRNPGQIDLRAIKTFGLSSKSGQNKIGRFGTGLKYATAVIARNGGEASIWTDGAWHNVGQREEEFRDQTITQLTMDGADLPFTTDLGRDWENWMAFRELYSNALDEGGNVERADALPTATDGETVIAVKMDAFEAIYFSMEEHFIGSDESPVWESDAMAVYAGRSHFVFYKGIAIQKLKEPAAFRYNLKGYIDLTEDRTAKYSWQVNNQVCEAVLACDCQQVLEAACDQRNPFEAKLDFSDVSTKPSESFLGAAVALGVNSNPTATAVVRSQLPPDGSTATVISKGTPGAEALSNALSVARRIGADLSKAKFVLAEGVPMYGDFDIRGDAVFLAESIFDNPERMTLAVIEGYAGIVGRSWMAKRLIAVTEPAS